MMPDFPQDLDSFSGLIALMKSINKDVKFLFIEQYTESDLELDVSIKTDDIFWVKFYAGHKNTGVHYLDTLDDTIMKKLYTQDYQINQMSKTTSPYHPGPSNEGTSSQSDGIYSPASTCLKQNS